MGGFSSIQKLKKRVRDSSISFFTSPKNRTEHSSAKVSTISNRRGRNTKLRHARGKKEEVKDGEKLASRIHWTTHIYCFLFAVDLAQITRSHKQFKKLKSEVWLFAKMGLHLLVRTLWVLTLVTALAVAQDDGVLEVPAPETTTVVIEGTGKLTTMKNISVNKHRNLNQLNWLLCYRQKKHI